MEAIYLPVDAKFVVYEDHSLQTSLQPAVQVHNLNVSTSI